MKKKRPASSYLLMLLSAIAVILILLIIYFTVRQQNVSTSTQTEIQTASAREEDGFTSGDAEADDGFTSGDIADAADSPEGFSERESAGPMPVTQAPEQADASQDPSADQPEPAPDDSSQPSEAHANTPEANAEDGAISPSQGNSVFDNKADQTMEDLLAQIRLALPVSNGSWSVYICDLSGGSEGTINDFSMQAASLIKLYIMGAVYENYDSLAQSHSTDELDSNISSMITVSDNDAANALVNWLGNGDDGAGMAKVNEFCQNHDFTSTQMNRMLLSGNENGDNYTSARDCGTFLKEIYQISNGTISDSTLPNAEAMYYQLKMQQRKNKIPAQLPEGVHTANKTGELDTVENDAAIIFDTAKGINLIVCFMSQDLTDTEAARQTIAADARAIYGYYNE